MGDPTVETLFESGIEALYSPLHQSATKEAIQAASARRTSTVSDMRTYLQRIGLPLTAFGRKKLVHITGTKGKGSTACLVEGILRNAYGLRTGLFTSPHLVDIRERIRINGRPVSKQVFGEVYWKLRRRLEDSAAATDTEKGAELPILPGYFRMLALMVSFWTRSLLLCFTLQSRLLTHGIGILHLCTLRSLH